MGGARFWHPEIPFVSQIGEHHTIFESAGLIRVYNNYPVFIEVPIRPIGRGARVTEIAVEDAEVLNKRAEQKRAVARRSRNL